MLKENSESEFLGLTLGEIFLKTATRYPERVFAYNSAGASVTYAQALLGITEIAKELQSLGIRRGNHVVFHCETFNPTFCYIMACQYLGAISVPISPIFSPNYSAEIARRLKTKFLAALPELEPEFRASDVAIISLENDIFNFSALGHDEFQNSVNWLTKIHEGVTCQFPLMLQPTSGSTGVPKLVIRAHTALTHYARHLAPELATPRDSQHRYLMLLSYAHSFAYHQTTTALILGAALAIPVGLDASVSLGEVWKLQPTILSLPPRVLRSFAKQDKQLEIKPPRLFPESAESVVIGGGKGSEEILSRLDGEGVKPIEIFSSSESSMISLTPRGQWRQGYTGRPLKNVKLKLAEDGEILVQSPGIMIGYFDDAKADLESFTPDGFYRTGDIGELDKDGYLKMLGRKKDVFNTPEGSNIFPERIEQMVEGVPNVSQAFLVGDGMPYLSVMAVVGSYAGQSIEPDGYLPPEKNESLYRNLGSALEKINLSQERIEKIIRFALFAQEFPPSCYAKVMGAKVRRNRPAMGAHFIKMIEHLYNSPDKLDLTYVPGVDRRLRPTGRNASTVPAVSASKKTAA